MSCPATGDVLGDAVLLTRASIGCTAGAIALGLVGDYEKVPLEGARVYTEIMRESSGKGDNFVPPSPAEFSDGTVYACKDSDRGDYSLFGSEDRGRYGKKETARRAVKEMMSVQPANTQGVFYFSPDYYDTEITPDVVVLSLRPVELCRLIQGYQFLTGERVRADVGGLRAGCSDLIVFPYLTGTINFSPYCLGARLIARFEGDRMGMGMPFSIFEVLVQGVEESRTGYPFSQYPGCNQRSD